MPVPPVPTFTAGETAGVVAKLNQLGASLTYWQNPPSCVASLNAATTLGTGAWSGFALVEVVDTDTMHDDVTNPSRLIAKTAGRYLVTAYATFATNATGSRGIQVRLNSAGSSVGGSSLAQSIITANSVGGSSPFVVFEYVLAVNDYMEMFAYQSSGAGLGMAVGHPFTYHSARLTAVS